MTVRLHRGLASAFLLIACLACAGWAGAAEREVRIGVLSSGTLAQTRQQWQPTADYLGRAVPGHRFIIVPMFFPELDAAVDAGKLEFVLTSPEHYVRFHADHGMDALATLMPYAGEHPVNRFGGVIFTRADSKIRELAELRGKKVSAVGENSFGGQFVQRWTLIQWGVGIHEFAGMRYTGVPHDRVVSEVLSGRADAGFVRTGILERMAREGAIRLDQLRVLNRQPEETFPQLLSTDLYPEWPFAALAKVPFSLSKEVKQALLAIGEQDEAARRGGYYGFTPPGDYAPVEAVMMRLHLHPGHGGDFDWLDVYEKYTVSILGGLAALLAAVLLAVFYLWNTNRNLRRLYGERDHLALELITANALLEEKVSRRTSQLQDSREELQRLLDSMAEGTFGVDGQCNFSFVNAAFLRMLGFADAAEVLGKPVHGLIHHSRADGSPCPEGECQLTQALRNGRELHCDEEVFWRKDGSCIPVEYWGHPVIKGGVAIGAVVTFMDITERKKAEQEIYALAFHDALTQLPNRRLLIDRLGKAMAASVRNRNHGALMFLDLDYFKKLNDVHGHDFGDLLLVEVARRITGCLREQDSAARFGGDEFVILLDDLSVYPAEAAHQAGIVAEKVRATLARPYVLSRDAESADGETIEHFCSSSIGVTVFCGNEEGEDELLKRTDLAMYQAKNAGRNAIRFFDPAMQAAIEERATLEADLRRALEQQQFRLHYQIQVDCSRQPQGAEVLLRWEHPQRGLLMPADFVPLAEENGMIVQIGQWVLDAACAQLRAWHADPRLRDLQLAVNVSPRQFHQPDFVWQVQETLERHGVNPLLLKLELTESMVLENVEDNIAKMVALKEVGVRFSLDDFGTGYSSLSYLKRLPLDQIKIDQSFVRDIASDQGDKVMVLTMVDMGMNFEVDVIAEGVETEEQFNLLKRYGCSSFQGYLFNAALPVVMFEASVLDAMHESGCAGSC
ncbi:MAG: EAL domain-containing protein [Nitrosomonadales bacterium]|nr:EAL domain-containing protein [Nitrosomonadales bacterium]